MSAIGTLEIEIIAGISKLQSSMNRAEKTVDGAMRNVEKSVNVAKNALGGLGGAFTIGKVIQLADEYKRFDSQLKLATKTAYQYGQAYSDVVRIARASQSDIGAIGVLYARLSNNLRDAGTSQASIGKIAESVSLSLRVSNATVQETNSVMLQLSQSFGSGKINGQEFLAVSEGAPIILRQLAKSLVTVDGNLRSVSDLSMPELAKATKVTYGQLKDLSTQGKLTADVLGKALNDPEFLSGLRANVTAVGTVSSSISVLKNNAEQFIGEADKGNGATKSLAKGIIFLADNISTLATGAMVVVAAKTTQYVASLLEGIKATAAAALGAKAKAAIEIQAEKDITAAKAAAIEKSAALNKLKETGRFRNIELIQAEARANVIAAQAETKGLREAALAQNLKSKASLESIKISRDELIVKNQLLLATVDNSIKTIESQKTMGILLVSVEAVTLAEKELSLAQAQRSIVIKELDNLQKLQLATNNQIIASEEGLTAISAKEAGALKVLEAQTYKLMQAKWALTKYSGVLGVSLENNASASTLAASKLVSVGSAVTGVSLSARAGALALSAWQGVLALLGGWIGIAIIALGALAYAIDKALDKRKIEKYGEGFDKIIEKQKELNRLKTLGVDSGNIYAKEISDINEVAINVTKLTKVYNEQKKSKEYTHKANPNKKYDFADKATDAELASTLQQLEIAKNSYKSQQTDLGLKIEQDAINSKEKIKGVSDEYKVLKKELVTLNEMAIKYAASQKLIREEGVKDGLSQSEIEAKLALLKKNYDRDTGANKAAKDTAKTQSQISDYKRLSLEINEKIALNKQELEVGAALTDGEAKLVKIREEHLKGKIKLTGAEFEALKVLAESLTLQEKKKILDDEALKFNLEQAKAYEDVILASTKQNESIQTEIDNTKEKIIVTNLSEAAYEALTIQRLKDAIATNEQLIAQGKLNGLSGDALAYAEDYIASLKEQLKLKEQLANENKTLESATEQKKARDERVKLEKDAIEDIAKAQQKASDDFSKSLTDAIFRGFEGGKSIVENFKQTLINSFKTLILQPTIKLLLDKSGISGIVGTISSLIDGGIKNKEGATVNGGIGSFSNMFSGVKSVFDNVTGAIASTVTKIGSAISNFGSTGTGFIKDIVSKIGSFTQLNAGILSSAFTGIGLAITAFSVIKSLFGKKKIPRYSTGREGEYDNGVFKASAVKQTYKKLGAEKQLDGLAEQFSKTFGAFLTGFGFDDKIKTTDSLFQKRKASYANFTASFAGGSVSAGTTGKAKDVQGTFARLVETVLGETIVKAIQASQVYQGIKDLFEGITDKAVVASLIMATTSLNAQEVQLNKQFGLTVDVAAKVVKASGAAGQGLADFANKLTLIAQSSQSVGDSLLNAKTNLVKQLGNVYGDIVTEAVTSTVARQVAIQPTQTTSTSPLSWLNSGTKESSGLLSVLNSFMTTVPQQFKTVTEQVTTYVDKLISKAVALPKSLAEFDALIKSVNTSTLAGQKQVADLLQLRESFGAYTQAIDGLKTNLAGATLDLRTPEEQARLKKADLDAAFRKLGVATPKTIKEFLALADSIDYSTKFGLDLAAALPSLAAGFAKTQDSVEKLAASLRDESSFKTLFDFQKYTGLANNYGAAFAESKSFDTPMASNTVNNPTTNITNSTNTTSSTSTINPLPINQPIAPIQTQTDATFNAQIDALLLEVRVLKAVMERNVLHSKRTADVLVNVTPNGNAIQTEAYIA